MCPLALVRSIFSRVRQERLPISRHVVRVTPFQKVFFPNENELEENVQSLVQSYFGITTIKKSPDAPIETESKKRKISSESEDAQNITKLIDEVSDQTVNMDGVNNVVSESDLNINGSTSDAVLEEKNVQEAVNAPCLLSDSMETTKVITPIRKFVYTIQFKARNHNVLDRQAVHAVVMKNMPSFSRPDKTGFEVNITVF